MAEQDFSHRDSDELKERFDSQIAEMKRHYDDKLLTLERQIAKAGNNQAALVNVVEYRATIVRIDENLRQLSDFRTAIEAVAQTKASQRQVIVSIVIAVLGALVSFIRPYYWK